MTGRRIAHGRSNARGRPALAALGIGATLLSGILLTLALRPQPASTAVPVPLPRAERLALYDEDLDGRWDATSALFPDVPRPLITPVITGSAEDWALGLSDCFADRGVVASITPLGETSYVIPAGTPSADFAVTEFVCTATHPRPGTFDDYLSDSERSALYDYYVGTLVPCLELHGSTVAAAPARADFVSYQGADVVWAPMPEQPVADPVALERACPAEPAWQRDGDL